MKDFKDYKQMENSGWENMHSLLDLQMPQKKKRFALLYFMYFMFGALMLISFLSWLNYESIPKHTNAPKESPMAIDYPKGNLESNEYLPISSSLQSNEKSNDQKLNRAPKSGNTTYYSSNNKINGSKFNKTQPDNTKPDIDSIFSLQDGDQHNSKNGIDPNESASITNDNSNDVTMDIPLLPGLALPSILSNQNDKLFDHLLLPTIIKPVANKSTGKIQFGIQAGVQYFTANKTISYLAGINADYNLTDKWSLSLSPSLEMKKGNFLILNDEERSLIVNSLDSFRVFTDLFSDTNKEVVLSNPSSGFSTVPIERISHLFNLQLPLTLNYKLNRHWQTSLGMKFLIPLQKDLITSSKSNIIQWDDQKTSTWKVKPVNYFAQVGIKYYPVYSLGISLDYSVAFSEPDVYQVENKTSFNQVSYIATIKNLNHLSAALNYRF